MREILFRGKRVDNGEWETGYYVRANYHWHKHGIHKDWIVTGACSNGGWFALHGRYPVVSDTVGQYTGLTDKNGKRIFEGDIVRGRDALEKGLVVEGYIDHQYGSFCIVGDLITHFRWMDYEVEVIGNIHDNPELIGGKEDGQD